MQNFDVTLKLLLQSSDTLIMRELAGNPVTKWLDIELPKVQNLRLDLLGETVDGHLVHIELQSANDLTMPLRMAEYCLGVRRLLGRLPRQIVLYVGEAPLKMSDRLIGDDFSFQYRLIDIRTLDGQRLLESDRVGDNVIAILARWQDKKVAVRRIVERIAELTAPDREKALAQLFILAGLRRLGQTVEEEAQKMPIQTSILEHDVLGPLFQKGCREGEQKGLRTGLEKGLQEGESKVLRRLIEKRFGSLPPWAEQKLEALPAPALDDLVERILDAKTIDELFA